MSVFEKSKKFLTILGIRIVPKETLSPILQDFPLTVNRIQILCLTFLIGTYFVTLFCTLIFKENTFSEMTQVLLFFVIGLVHSTFCYISMWKRPKIMAYMDDLEKIIEKSVFEISSISNVLQFLQYI